MRVLVAHSWNAPVLGTHYTQGDEFYTTGNYGQSSGEHLHMEVASVTSKQAQYWNSGGIGIYGANHMWLELYVNDTAMLRPENYDWKTYDVPPIPPYNKGDFIVTFNTISRSKRKEVEYGNIN